MSWFITFEGPEGSGKSTLCPRIAGHLTGLGYAVLQTREPGGTDIGRQIRAFLLDPRNAAMQPTTEFLLFSASRAQLVAEVIRPHLENGGVVLCDRYADSSLAYQGAGHGLDANALRAITSFATGGLQPDLTILFDIEVETGLRRRRAGSGEWNRLDAAALEFHRRARQGFLALAESEPERWVVLDASRSVAAVEAELRGILAERLPAAVGEVKAGHA